jgi:hypothetical protein
MKKAKQEELENKEAGLSARQEEIRTAVNDQ